MSVGLLIITHNDIGDALLRAAISTFGGRCPLHVETIAVANHSDPDHLRRKAHKLSAQLNDGGGVLVLTDIYGSTPAKIATSLTPNPQIAVLAGINLPMLIKIFNYPHADLEHMTANAIAGAQTAIISCDLADSQFCQDAADQVLRDIRAA